ncbi:hypothetical protein ACLMAL_28750 [Nocardia sp. CWNU-33]|uniref:hypothetical protein n=1 Tax=Nocardia sp. CWNU-33 TaxID=3392117 RepID=UPI00398E4382
MYCRDKLGIDPDRLNVDGGAIAVGHPYRMTGSRLVGHAPHRSKAPGACVMSSSPCCIGGGMVAAGRAGCRGRNAGRCHRSRFSHCRPMRRRPARLRDHGPTVTGRIHRLGNPRRVRHPHLRPLPPGPD